jgi:hypothetical protein
VGVARGSKPENRRICLNPEGIEYNNETGLAVCSISTIDLYKIKNL